MSAEPPFANAPVPPGRRHDGLRRIPPTVAVAAPWAVGLPLACVGSLVAQTGARWLSCALIVAWFVVLDRAFGIPTRAWIPAPVQWLLPLAVLVAAAGLLPDRARSGDWLSVAVIAESGVLLTLLGVAVWSSAAARRIPDAPVAQFPLREGKWLVMQGEGRALNHHWRAPAQRAALDLVRLGALGMSHTGKGATGVERFYALGSTVYSPCNGTVVDCRDGDPDQPTPGVHPAGNHLVIAADGVQILLAHLAAGSLLVRTGQQVHAGQQIARVGHSGRSSEPHLHIHAQWQGRPRRLRFVGRRKGYRRGATVSA